VTHFYDPLLAKLIVHGESREVAIQKMDSALRDFIVHGVTTNIDFMQAVLAHQDFVQGKVSTRWVENNFNWSPPSEPLFESLVAASLFEIMLSGSKSQAPDSNEVDPYSPWKSANGFRIGGNHG
jgi:acetyl/propionyl-CoA carboxylase alpha subunit